jgi:uncharacterized membrane protein YhaH (DUF805 family)
MGAIRFLFGFDGRLARGRFWVFGLALYALATLALAFDPVTRSTVQTLVWLPASTVLLIYLFTGMWGFSIAVLTMAVDLFIVRGSGGRVVLVPFLIAVALCVLLGWVVVAVASKRLHDRGKSGWWLLLFVVAPLLLVEAGVPTANETARMVFAYEAFALHLWSFVELGCRRGTRGANRYGPDPVAVAEAGPAAAMRIAG